MKLSHWLFTLIAFFLIAALIYSPSLGGPFQYDDYAQILDNKVLTGRPLPKLLSSIFRFTAHPDGWTGSRDFVRATFLLNWQWWGEKPLGYRWTNLAIHVVNAWLVTLLIWQLLETVGKTVERYNGKTVISKTVTGKPVYRSTDYRSTVSPFHRSTDSFPSIPNLWIAVGAGLLFLVHPIQSQAVAYVAQRFTSVATLFYLLTIILYIIYNNYKNYNYNGYNRYKSYIIYGAALISAALAYNSKEIAVTLPVVLALVTGYQFSVIGFRSQVNRFSVSQSETDKLKTGKPKTDNRKQKTDNRIKTILLLLPFFLLALKIPLQTATAAAKGSDPFVNVDGSDPFAAERRIKIELGAFALRQKDDLLSRRDYFLTQISVVGTYLRLAVLPVNQTLDYDYPITKSWDSKTIALTSLHLSLIGLGSWLLLRSLRNFSPRPNVSQTSVIRSFVYSFIRLFRYFPPSNPSVPSPSSILPLLGFGILWFYLTLLPESSIIPIPDVIYEHRAYLPLVGLIIAAAAGAAAARSAAAHETHKSHETHVSHVVVAAAFLLILAAATLRRAYIWGNEVRLWHDVYAKAPEKPRAVKNYGVVLAASGKYDDGIKLLEKAVVLDPDNADYWSNLGTANLRAGRYDSAKDKFLKAYQLLAAELNFPSYDSLNPLSPPNSLTSPSEKSRRQAAQYLNDYGVCLVQLGRGDEALPAFQKSLAIDPGLYAARLGLGAAYNLMGETQQAIDVFEAAVEEFPDLPDAYNNLAVMYKKAGRLEDHDRILRAAPKNK